MPSRCCTPSAVLLCGALPLSEKTSSLKRAHSSDDFELESKTKMAKLSPQPEEACTELPSPSTDSGIDLSFESVMSEVSNASKRRDSEEETEEDEYSDSKLIPEDIKNSPKELRMAIVFLQHLLQRIVKTKGLPTEDFADLFFPLRATLRAHERRLMTLKMEMD